MSSSPYLLSSPDEEASTLALVRSARRVAARAAAESRSSSSSGASSSGDVRCCDPTTIAALSAVSVQMLQGRGVLVNVIDPTAAAAPKVGGTALLATTEFHPDTPPPRRAARAA